MCIEAERRKWSVCVRQWAWERTRTRVFCFVWFCYCFCFYRLYVLLYDSRDDFAHFFLYAHSSSVVFSSISLVRTYAKLAHLDHTSIVLLCTLFGTIVSMCIIVVVLWLSIIVDLQMLLFNCHKIIWWITLYSALLFRVLCFAFANCVLTIHSNVIQFGDDAHHLISNVEL